MNTAEIKATRAAKKVANVQPTPINTGFISIKELLARLQTLPAEPQMTMSDTAEWLLFNWCNAEKKPAWKCNGKFGIVPLNAFHEENETPLQRLHYVCCNGSFASDDGMGVSTDYELFGFDRKEFEDFMALLGEPLDLHCSIHQADSAPLPTAATLAPVVAASASGGVETGKAGPLVKAPAQGNSTKTRRRDSIDPVIKLAQAKCRDPKDTNQVWPQMQVLAENEQAPFLASMAEGLKYHKGGKDAYFTRDALDKRLHPEKRKPAARR